MVAPSPPAKWEPRHPSSSVHGPALPSRTSTSWELLVLGAISFSHHPRWGRARWWRTTLCWGPEPAEVGRTGSFSSPSRWPIPSPSIRRWTVRAVGPLVCQMGVRIASMSALVTVETGT